MSASFNPFETWLGLPPELDNPNYFELLGIDPDCDDEGAIRAAAKRQLAKIRAIRPGEQARQWTELIDKLCAAEKCLCQQASRVEYRQGLANTTSGSMAAWQPPSKNKQPPADEIPTALPTAVPIPQTTDDVPAPDSAPATPAPTTPAPTTPAPTTPAPTTSVHSPVPVPPPAPESVPGQPPETFLDPQQQVASEGSFDVTPSRTSGKKLNPRQRNKRGCLILMAGQVVIALIAILFAVWLMSDETRIARLKQALGMGATADEPADKKDDADHRQKDPKHDQKSDTENKVNGVDKKNGKSDAKEKGKSKQGDNKSKTDLKNGKQKTKTGNGKSDNKLPDHNHKNNGQKTDVPLQPDYNSLTPVFRFYCRFALQNLELRHFDHAKFAILHLQKLDLNESERIINSRLLAVNEAYESFWQTVDTYSMRVAAGDQIFLEGRPEPVGIVESDNTRVVFRTGGENRRYKTRQLPNLVAEAFATRQLGKGATDLNLQIAVFRGSHCFRDPKFRLEAVDQLKRLMDETEEVLPLIKFFEDDLPEISKIKSTTLPATDQVNARSREIEIAAKLVSKRKVDPSFWDKSFSGDDSVEQKARLQLAIKYLSRSGDSTAVSLFDYSELRFAQKNGDAVMFLTKTFQPDRSPEDTGAMIEWSLGKLEDPGYRWKTNQIRLIRRHLLLAATKSGLANKARKIENLGDPK